MMTFRPVHRPLYQPVYLPQKEYTRHSLTGALWNRFVIWVEKSPLTTIGRTAARASCALLIATGVLAPRPLLRASLALMTWHGWAIPLICAGLATTLNARRIYRLTKRWSASPSRSSNQHTYQGIPVDELASKLLEWGAFKRDTAMEKLRITQPKWQAIAHQLEAHQVLVRGECNALVLNTITREQLVAQLTALAAGEAPPLLFDADRKEWNDRESSYALHLRDKARQEEREEEKVARRERRVERAEKKLSTFQAIMAGEPA